MRIGYVVVALACIQSVRAIESPGGDDDRQWLAFWIIYVGLHALENLSDVLLSWVPAYYQVCSLCVCV